VVFVPFEVVEKACGKDLTKSWAVFQFLFPFAKKMHPVLYLQHYRKTEDAARTFLVQVSYNI